MFQWPVSTPRAIASSQRTTNAPFAHFLATSKEQRNQACRNATRGSISVAIDRVPLEFPNRRRSSLIAAAKLFNCIMFLFGWRDETHW